MAAGSPTGRRCRARGFAYVILLMAVAVIGVAAAGALGLGASMQRRQAERQLLVIGLEYQRALASYAAGTSRGPRELSDLLRDPRVPGIRRHLRRIHPDPLLGKAEWGLVRNPQGEIVGIYSLAPGKPTLRSGFAPELAHLEQAASYQDWVFGAVPVTLPRSPATRD